MADYIAKTRTNYFKVTDPEAFKELMQHCSASSSCGCTIEVYFKYGETSTVMFCCEGSFDGMITENPEDADFDQFVEELQKLLPENEVCIITEIGAEKLRYLTAYSNVISKNEIRQVSLDAVAMKEAGKMLNDPDYKTEMEY